MQGRLALKVIAGQVFTRARDLGQGRGKGVCVCVGGDGSLLGAGGGGEGTHYTLSIMVLQAGCLYYLIYIPGGREHDA